MIIISCDDKNAINLSNYLMFQLLESSQYLIFFQNVALQVTHLFSQDQIVYIFTRSLGHAMIFKIFKVCLDLCAQTSSITKKK